MSVNLASMHEDPPGIARTLFPCMVAGCTHWKLSQEHPGDPTLNIPARWRLEGDVVPAPMEPSLQTIIEHHEILHTRFVERDGLLLQLVMPKVPFNPRQVDLAELPAVKRPAAAGAMFRQEPCLSFDLTRLPLLRVTLLWLEPPLCGRLLTPHHLVGDFWSSGALVREMTNIYAAPWSGRTPVLRTLDTEWTQAMAGTSRPPAGRRHDLGPCRWPYGFPGSPPGPVPGSRRSGHGGGDCLGASIGRGSDRTCKRLKPCGRRCRWSS